MKKIIIALLIVTATSLTAKAQDTGSVLTHKMNEKAGEKTYSSKETVYKNKGKEIRMVLEFYPEEKVLEISFFLTGKECVKKGSLINFLIKDKGIFGAYGDQEKNCKGKFVLRSMINEDNYQSQSLIEGMRDHGIEGVALTSSSGVLEYSFTEAQSAAVTDQLKEIFTLLNSPAN